jgi:hypothetical protein
MLLLLWLLLLLVLRRLRAVGGRRLLLLLLLLLLVVERAHALLLVLQLLQRCVAEAETEADGGERRGRRLAAADVDPRVLRGKVGWAWGWDGGRVGRRGRKGMPFRQRGAAARGAALVSLSTAGRRALQEKLPLVGGAGSAGARRFRGKPPPAHLGVLLPDKGERLVGRRGVGERRALAEVQQLRGAGPEVGERVAWGRMRGVPRDRGRGSGPQDGGATHVGA